MKDKVYNNADSFAISFDEEWQKVNCNDLCIKIEKGFKVIYVDTIYIIFCRSKQFLIYKTTVLLYPIFKIIFKKNDVSEMCNTC